MRAPAALLLALPALAQPLALQERADRFLALVNANYQALTYVSQQAQWLASTDVTPAHDASAETAGRAYAAFMGNPSLIQEAKALLAHRDQLKPITVRQLERILLMPYMAEGPMTKPELTAARIAAETRQASVMNGFQFKVKGQPVTANDIDNLLARSADLAERQTWWEASKEIGVPLKEGLVKLRDLRNGVAKELGYSDYFALQAARYGLSTDELMAYNRRFLEELRPLYLQLHTWVKYELAKKYHQPVPKKIPAHWLNNRWSQNWTGLVGGVDFDPYFKAWSPERIVKTAEAFYTGLGFPALPASFWAKSDLYPVPKGDPRKKNAHASCWHLDLDQDIRSLMSVEPNMEWFSTTHHELGHGYYFMSYSRPEVPPLLREGANPSFHEGVGELIALATRQVPYLKSAGVLPADYQADEMQVLLNDALEVAIPFMAWACGTMPEWEQEFYGQGMPADRMNARWWEIVAERQGVEPPSPRGAQWCDPATKTHINDNPAYYYSYGWATVFKFQMHDHICRHLLKQDPRHANYAGNKAVGDFLKQVLAKGATEDWRKVLKDATGEDLSTRAMKAYFAPLMAWLEKQNQGRPIGW
jgi:peptidyl-dipeptidase A